MAVDAARAKSLFLAASDMSEATDRAAYLNRECGGDAELRGRVEALLRANDASPLPTEATSAQLPDRPQPTEDYADPAARVGSVIAGKYKLLQQIGEGGMGSVWMADQTEPVKRRVAVKLIRTERGSSKTILARFEAERQAIALMDHPNIAKLLDAGTTENSSPYFVMELVKGVPLTEFCDAHKLSIPARLNLFMQICSAVQHAHQKGIIHRDLKPSNILVELHDDKPVPKVIDFGLAKATSGMQLTENTLFTGFGTVAGTPLYMAPEQANFNAVDIDTRADIYALGVILYELLTGTTPISRETIKKAALDEMMKLIREQEAPTPSSRLSSSETKPTVAANRHSEPQKLGRYIKGELDWIVMKALSKERDRRYETANGFARDIERFLNHEPVQAGPVSAGYRLRKFVRRNKGKVLAVSVVMLTLLAGIVGTTVGLIQANLAAEEERKAKDDAVAARTKEAEQRIVADAQRQAAEKRLTQIEKSVEILTSVFKNLNPRSAEKDGLPLTELLGKRLDQATQALEGDAVGDPVAVAKLQLMLAESQRELGYLKKAVALSRKAHTTLIAKLGTDDAETLRALDLLAVNMQVAGQLEQSLALHEEAYRRSKEKLGPDHRTTHRCLANLALGLSAAGQHGKALPLSKESLRQAKIQFGQNDHATLNALNNLAMNHRHLGQVDQALPLLEELLQASRSVYGPNHADTLMAMHNLAGAYEEAGRVDDAAKLYEETLQLRRAVLGSDHPETMTTLNNLAIAYRELGRTDRWLPLLEECFERTKARRGPDHPDTLVAMNNLGSAYIASHQPDKGFPLMEEAFRLMKAKLSPNHPLLLQCMTNLGSHYHSAGQFARALPLVEESLQRLTDTLGPDHPDRLVCLNNLASLYQDTGRLNQALPLYEEGMRRCKAKFGQDHPNTFSSMNNLADAFHDLKRYDEALALFQETLDRVQKMMGPNHPMTIHATANLGKTLLKLGRFDDALKQYTAFVGRVRKAFGQESGQTAAMISSISLKLLEAGQFVAAEGFLSDALAIWEKGEPNAWSTFNTKSMLGGALVGQRKYAEAEPMLIKGYEGMKQREKTIPPQASARLPEALDRLIQLYTETNKPDEVKKWQAEKSKLPKPPEKK